MKNFYESAYVLYDGGWRAEDKEDIMEEYDFTAEEASTICEVLAEMEVEK